MSARMQRASPIRTEDHLHGLVDRIYESAVRPSLWQNTVYDLALATGSTGAHAVMCHPGNETSHGYSDVTHAEAHDEYSRNYANLDLRLSRALARPPGVFSEQELMTPGEIARCPVHNEMLAVYDLRHSLFGTKRTGNRGLFILATLRSARSGPYGSHEYKVTRLLLPHVYRAMQLEVALRNLEHRLNAGIAVLDALATGVVLVNPKGRVVHLNSAAEAIAAESDGLTVRQGRLVTASPEDQRDLDRAVSAATNSANTRTGSEVVVARPSGKPAYRLQLLPLARERTRLMYPGAVATVLIKDPEMAPIDASKLLAQAFGLTAGESGLAQALAGGERITDYAERTGIPPDTARWRLRRLFEKTGTHRQPALVSLLVRTLRRP